MRVPAVQGDPRSRHERTSLVTLLSVEEFARWYGKQCRGVLPPRSFGICPPHSRIGAGSRRPLGGARAAPYCRGVLLSGHPFWRYESNLGEQNNPLLRRPSISPHNYRLAQPTIGREGLAVEGPLALRRCTFSLLDLRRLALALLFAERVTQHRSRSLPSAPARDLPTYLPPFPAHAPCK